MKSTLLCLLLFVAASLAAPYEGVKGRKINKKLFNDKGRVPIEVPDVIEENAPKTTISDLCLTPPSDGEYSTIDLSRGPCGENGFEITQRAIPENVPLEDEDQMTEEDHTDQTTLPDSYDNVEIEPQDNDESGVKELSVDLEPPKFDEGSWDFMTRELPIELELPKLDAPKPFAEEALPREDDQKQEASKEVVIAGSSSSTTTEGRRFIKGVKGGSSRRIFGNPETQ